MDCREVRFSLLNPAACRTIPAVSRRSAFLGHATQSFLGLATSVEVGNGHLAVDGMNGLSSVRLKDHGDLRNSY